MTAQEMFEELEFRKVDVIDQHGDVVDFVIEYEQYDGNFYYVISFNNSTKLMHTHCELFNITIDFTCYTPNLLRAIHKQCEELGWIE